MIQTAISRIGLGTAHFGLDYGFNKAKTQPEVDALLESALENGINFLDTARGYGSSEEKIGQFLKRKDQRDFVIATKLSKINEDDLKVKSVLQKKILSSIDQSRQALGCDHLDILYIHQSDKFLINNPLFWECLVDYQQNKMFHSLGISVYDLEFVELYFERIKKHMQFIQLPWSIFDQRFKPLFKKLKKENINIIIRSIYLKGVIPLPVEKLPKELDGLKERKLTLKELTHKYQTNESTLALAFAMYQPEITSAVLGMDTVKEIEENVRASKEFKLKEEDFEELSALAVSEKSLIDPRGWKSL
ncbi:MAG: aldo/keto reductase [Candidatus Omnitrophica bacterium]|nr:aldo/keto reductase [Candidatus Omnitrophota bacterium]